MSVTGDVGSMDGRALDTPVGRELLALFDDRTRVRPWRLGSQPFPLVVLEAADPAAHTGAYVAELAEAATAAGIPHVRPALPATATTAPATAVTTAADDAARAAREDPPAAALLDTMAGPDAWNCDRHAFGRYRFPRSELIRSFEQALRRSEEKNAAHPGSSTPVEEWHDAAVLLPWSRRPITAPVWWSTVIVLVAAIFGGIAQGVADQTRLSTLVAMALILLSAVAVTAGLSYRRVWLPILSRMGFGTRYRWFAASSFFAVQGGTGFDERLRQALDRLAGDDAAEAADARLQMKTFAFLEDLRAAHRRLSPTLRGFKRPVPSVVFLDGVTGANGGIALLSAMSDIRSRRSELHPILVVASVEYEHRGDLDALAEPPGPGSPRKLRTIYNRWTASLGSTQAPSSQVRLPWVLRLPVPAQTADPDSTIPALARRRRPAWIWLWSRRSLLAALAALTVGGSYLHAQLRSEHCEVRYLFWANTDTRLRTDNAGSRECVGVATGRVRFERGSLSIGLDGDERSPHAGNRAGRLTAADLLDLIRTENDIVLRSHQPYVTILYAGMLTAASGDEDSAVTNIRQLAGAYLAQQHNNRNEAGGVGNPLKVRLLAVNAGQNMAFSDDAADRVIAIARRDRTVVGVVGMGRNTEESHKAIQRMNDAGLAIVDPVNSSDELPALPFYYGLAATDHDEAATVRRALGGRPAGRTLIVYRFPGAGRDYSTELADDAREVLRPARYTPLAYNDAGDIGGKVRAACDGAAGDPYDLVYFAGRAEDLRGLVASLAYGGCATHPLTLLGGDEVSRASFGSDPHQVVLPDDLTVYYTTFTHLPNLMAGGRDQDNPFFVLARNVLGIGTDAAGRPLLADGQMAMAYDSTAALAQAAEKAFDRLGLAPAGRVPSGAGRALGSGSVTSGSVLLELPNLTMPDGATGAIDFTHDLHTRGGSGGRGLTLIKVTVRNRQPSYQPVCGQLNGGGTVRGLPLCR